MMVKSANPTTKSWKIAVIAGLIGSAIVLHIFKIPYPPATFLKFDLCGIPLMVSAFIALIETTVLGLPVFYLGIFALGGAMDPIGPSMKVLAELSTFLPVVAMYRRVKPSTAGLRSLLPLVAIAAVSRVSVMCLINLAVTPYWLQIMGWVKSWEQAWSFTIFILPHIAVFNTVAAVYVALLSIPLIRIVKAMGVTLVGEKEGARS
ncbi:MAG: hypothetical protein QXJ95_03885 [Ignisphaera sp.]|uniref:ECF transporter S component n=1 Tax=Ignisphaera aggregans TaxID=334771 RepID=A0A7J3I8V6_9CREN